MFGKKYLCSLMIEFWNGKEFKKKYLQDVIKYKKISDDETEFTIYDEDRRLILKEVYNYATILDTYENNSYILGNDKYQIEKTKQSKYGRDYLLKYRSTRWRR
jgi:hypothetical protein